MDSKLLAVAEETNLQPLAKAAPVTIASALVAEALKMALGRPQCVPKSRVR